MHDNITSNSSDYPATFYSQCKTRHRTKKIWLFKSTNIVHGINNDVLSCGQVEKLHPFGIVLALLSKAGRCYGSACVIRYTADPNYHPL